MNLILTNKKRWWHNNSWLYSTENSWKVWKMNSPTFLFSNSDLVCRTKVYHFPALLYLTEILNHKYLIKSHLDAFRVKAKCLERRSFCNVLVSIDDLKQLIRSKDEEYKCLVVNPILTIPEWRENTQDQWSPVHDCY